MTSYPVGLNLTRAYRCLRTSVPSVGLLADRLRLLASPIIRALSGSRGLETRALDAVKGVGVLGEPFGLVPWVGKNQPQHGSAGRANREQAIEQVLAIFRGRGVKGTRRATAPRSKWVAFNAIAEHLDYGRPYTTRTSQVQRSFEDTSLKQRAFELVSAA